MAKEAKTGIKKVPKRVTAAQEAVAVTGAVVVEVEVEETPKTLEETPAPATNSSPYELRPGHGFIRVTREGFKILRQLQKTLSSEELGQRFGAGKSVKDAPDVRTADLVQLMDKARREALEEKGINPDTSAPEQVTCSVQVSKACPKGFRPMSFLNGKAGSFVRRNSEGMDTTVLERATVLTESVEGKASAGGVILAICGRCRNFIKHLVFDEGMGELQPLLRGSTLGYLLGKAKQAEEGGKLLSTLVSKESKGDRKPKNQPFKDALGGAEFPGRDRGRGGRHRW